MSGAAIIIRQNRLMRRFREAGATSPPSAQALAMIGVRDSWIFRRMAARRVFLPTEDGRYYMDQARADEYVRQRRVRLWTIVAFLVALFLFVLVLQSR